MAGSAKLRWTSQEDALLQQLVLSQPNQGDAIPWHIISLSIPSRTPKQCRERWNGSLNPELNCAPWTDEEIEKVYTYINTLGTKWNDIAVHLGTGRSGLAIRNLYYAGLRREKRSHSKQDTDHNVTISVSKNKSGSFRTSASPSNQGSSTSLGTTTTVTDHKKSTLPKNTGTTTSMVSFSMSNEGTLKTKKVSSQVESVPFTTSSIDNFPPTGDTATKKIKKRGRPVAPSKSSDTNAINNEYNKQSSPSIVRNNASDQSSKKARKTTKTRTPVSVADEFFHLPSKGPWIEPTESTDPYIGNTSLSMNHHHARFGAALMGTNTTNNNVSVPGLWIPTETSHLPKFDTATVHHHSPSNSHMRSSNQEFLARSGRSSEHDPKKSSDGGSPGSNSIPSSAINNEVFRNHFVSSGPLSTSSTGSYLGLPSGSLTRTLQELNQSRNNSNNNNSVGEPFTGSSSSLYHGNNNNSVVPRGRGNLRTTVDYSNLSMYPSLGGPTMETVSTPLVIDQDAYLNSHNLLSMRNNVKTNGTETDGSSSSMIMQNDTLGMMHPTDPHRMNHESNKVSSRKNNNKGGVSPSNQSIVILPQTNGGSLLWNQHHHTADSLTAYHGTTISTPNLSMNQQQQLHSNNNTNNNLMFTSDSPHFHSMKNNSFSSSSSSTVVSNNPLHSNNFLHPTVSMPPWVGSSSTGIMNTQYNGYSPTPNFINFDSLSVKSGKASTPTTGNEDNNNTIIGGNNAHTGRSRGKNVNTAAEVLANLAGPIGFGNT